MLYLFNRLSKLYFYIEKILIFMQNLVVLLYLIKYLTLIGKIFIRIWNYYYILNEYQKLLTMLPSIEKYDNTYKFTLQVTSHIDGVAFHGFFLIPQQLTKWILSHRRYTIATCKTTTTTKYSNAKDEMANSFWYCLHLQIGLFTRY